MLIPLENHQQRRPRLSCQGTANQKALRGAARGMLDKTLIGKSAVMQEVKEKILKLCCHDTTVLIQGESGNPIEKAMYQEDPYAVNFPVRMKKLVQAIKTYVASGSKAELERLEEEKVLPKWILYDFIEACEKDNTTNSHTNLKAWMEGFLPEALVNEMFAKHQGEIDKVFGTKAELVKWLNLLLLPLEDPRYQGFQEPIR